MTDDTCNLKLLRVRTRRLSRFHLSSVMGCVSHYVSDPAKVQNNFHNSKRKTHFFGGRRNNLPRNRLRLNKRPKSVRMSIIMSIFAQTITKTVKNTIHIINNN